MGIKYDAVVANLSWGEIFQGDKQLTKWEISEEDAERLIAAHKAALEAERRKHDRELAALARKYEQQLAAERDAVKEAEMREEEWRKDLLAAQAAIAEHNRNHDYRCPVIDVSLVSLDKLKEDTRKPLVDALNSLIRSWENTQGAGNDLGKTRVFAFRECAKELREVIADSLANNK